MKKLLMALGFMTLGTGAWATTVNPVAVSSGTGFYTVDASSAANGNSRQNIVISDPNTTLGLATVDALTGLTVHLATSTFGGSLFFGVDHSTGVQVNTGGRFLGVDFSSGVKVNQGNSGVGWAVDLSTGVQINGTVTANQGTPNARFPGVDLSTGVNINGTVTANAGTPNTRFPGVDLSTGIKSNQGTAGASFWGVDMSTGVQANEGTPGTRFWGIDFSTGVKITGSLTTSSVNISTYSYGTTLGSVGTAIGGIGPNAAFQTFSVDNSSKEFVNLDLSTGVQVNTGGRFLGVDFSTGVKITGSLTTTSVNITTVSYGGAMVGQGNSLAFINYSNRTAQNQAVNFASHSLVGILPETSVASYSASTITITAASAATDIAALCGNASNTVLVYGLRVSCTETTAGNVNLAIVKRSSAYGTGQFSTITAVAEDSNYTTASSTAVFFTANGTSGTLLAYLDNYKLGCMATATATPNDIYIQPSDWRMKPIVLRGASQCIAVNLQGQTVTGGSFSTTFDWIETSTP